MVAFRKSLFRGLGAEGHLLSNDCDLTDRSLLTMVYVDLLIDAVYLQARTGTLCY